jgi:hypothetical protein
MIWTGSAWAPTTVGESHTFVVSGLVQVPSGATGYIPPMYVYVPTGTAKHLTGVRYSIRAGTSVTFNILYNGTVLSSGIQASTTAATFAIAGGNLADGDSFQVQVSAISGDSPDGLAVSLRFSSP